MSSQPAERTFCGHCCDNAKHHRDGGTCSHCEGATTEMTCEKHLSEGKAPSLRQRREAAQKEARRFQGKPIDYEDFVALMPMHQYIYRPTRDLWPQSSVDARLPAVKVKGKDTTIKAHLYLDQYRPVEQMTWWPGKPEIIRDRIFQAGTLLNQPGNRVYNMYRSPNLLGGDPDDVGPWLGLVRRLYPREADHIIRWMAHRVQCPHEKVNHALVLAGSQGIGKDTILDPLRTAVGEWNFQDISPNQILESFNGFVRTVVLRVNEARDLGEGDRYRFYEHMKRYTTSPPEVLSCNEKHIREYYVPNLMGVVLTTNHRTNGIYLPPNDRRHFVAWSDEPKGGQGEEYFKELWSWLEKGRANVAAYLRELPLDGFNPKAPPPQTDAFWAIVDANQAPEDDEMATALSIIGTPAALIVRDVTGHLEVDQGFKEWLRDRKNARKVAHRFETAGYVAVRNPDVKSGRWKIDGVSTTVYGRQELSVRDRILAARERTNEQLDLYREEM